MQIQDAHTHLFSRPFFDALAAASPKEESGEEILAQLSARSGVEVPGPDLAVHRQRWVAEMDANGVHRIVTFASLPQEAEAVSEVARESGGRMVPYTLVNPAMDTAAAFVERAFGELGFRGLLAFPAMHHVPMDDERWTPILDLARANRAPVVVHCGVLKVKLRDLVGLPQAYDIRLADPLRIVPAANRFPDVRFVVPHFGGGMFRETLLAGDQCENVWVDTSSSNVWMKTSPQDLDLVSVFRRSLDVFGAGRILFGTDSSVFPRGYRDDVRDQQLVALAKAGAASSDQEAVMGGNLARLVPA